MWTVLINQKSLLCVRFSSLKSSANCLRRVRAFALCYQDRKRERLWSCWGSWSQVCVLSGAMTHLSPLMTAIVWPKSEWDSTCKPITTKFLSLKDKSKAEADANISGSEIILRSRQFHVLFVCLINSKSFLLQHKQFYFLGRCNVNLALIRKWKWLFQAKQLPHSAFSVGKMKKKQ